MLLFKGKDTRISEDALKCIKGVCGVYSNFKKNTDEAVNAFNHVVYEFLEACKVGTTIYEIGYVVHGDGFDVPKNAICKMIHPKAMEVIEKDERPDFLMEQIED